MRAPLIGLAILTASLQAVQASSSRCSLKMNDETQSKVRAYMKSRVLILDGEEQSYPEMDVVTRWELTKVTPSRGGCFAVMRLCTVSKTSKDCDSFMEAVGIVTQGNQDQIVPFEKLAQVPKKAIAKIGTQNGNDRSYFFAMLTGKSVLDAYKSVVTSTPYYGFSGVAVRGKKAEFDPTPNRDWRIANPEFNLRRGESAEVLDIASFQLDGLDPEGAEGYWTGCQQPRNKYRECKVAPWGQAYVRELKAVESSRSKWTTYLTEFQNKLAGADNYL